MKLVQSAENRDAKYAALATLAPGRFVQLREESQFMTQLVGFVNRREERLSYNDEVVVLLDMSLRTRGGSFGGMEMTFYPERPEWDDTFEMIPRPEWWPRADGSL